MEKTKKVKLGDKEIEICLELEDGEEEIEFNNSEKNLETTTELNLKDINE